MIRLKATAPDMTLPPESEWRNLDWLTALRADSDQAWAAIRERVLRSLRAYLRGGVEEADRVTPEVAGALFETEDLQSAVRSFLSDGPGKATFKGE